MMRSQSVDKEFSYFKTKYIFLEALTSRSSKV